jgi:hypothetical protein
MKPGEKRLRQALEGRTRAKARARTRDPEPYEDDWGWWIEKRLARLEKRLNWIVVLAGGALAAETIRIGLAALGLVP